MSVGDAVRGPGAAAAGQAAAGALPGTMAGLVRFHAANKLLLLAHSERWMRVLGRVVANEEGLPVERVVAQYEAGFTRAVAVARTVGGTVDALLHGFGHVSDRLAAEERGRFVHAVEEYRLGAAPLEEPLGLLRGWAAAWGTPWLAEQTFLAPAPEAGV